MGRSGSRSFSIPVQVGTQTQKPELPEKAVILQSNEGERLLIQQGQETRKVKP